MITMDLYDYIRFAHINLGRSIESIHKETTKARETIRRAIKGIEPVYTLTKKKKKRVMEDYVEIVKKWLEDDRSVPKKQRHTGRRIYDRLVEEHDFKGSERTVRYTIHQLKEELGILEKEAFIPSDPEKREGGEMDWGECLVDIGETRTKVYMFCMRAKYSGKIFVKLYPMMNQECFFNGHIEAFGYFGGSFREIVYDNLKTAVQKVLQGKGRIEQQSFMSFRAYYAYKSNFCNIASGNEKSGVEGLVGYARKNFLVPIPKCNDLGEVNQMLLEKCIERDLDKTSGQEKRIGELFTEEKKSLLKLPERPYNNYKLIETKVDKYLTIKIGTNRYSVPGEYARSKVVVELGLSDIRVTYQNKLIARHERNYTKNQWILNPWHYVKLLRRKPGAFQTSRILTTIENTWNPIVKRLWCLQVAEYGQEVGTKEFLDTLLFFDSRTYDEMLSIIEIAIENKTYSSSSIKIIFDSLTEEKQEIANLEDISDVDIPLPDIEKFDLLGEVKDE